MSARVRMLAVVVSSVLLVVGVPTPAGAAPAPEQYVRYAGVVYSIAGGAPMRVNGWASVGRASNPPAYCADAPGTAGCVPDISAAQWAAYPAHVRDGTFIRGVADGKVWRIIDGGRPVHIGSWAPYGGEQTYYNVDASSITACDHLNCSPWGVLESAVATGIGQVAVSGWARDPEAIAGPVEYSWIVDNSASPASNSGIANQAHAGVPASDFRAGNFGFQRTIAVPSGTRSICLYLHDGGHHGQSQRMNCITVEVPAPPLPPTAFPSAPRKVKAVAKSRKAVVRWKPPTSSGDGPILKYVVRASTGQTATTTKTKALVRRLKPGKKVSFSVVAYNKFGAGVESRRTKKIAILR